MNDTLPDSRGATARQIVVAAVWMGLVVGLIEGIGWMVIQRLGRLTGVWTRVLWIAPTFDGLMFLGLGLLLAVLALVLPRRGSLPLAGFAIALAATANFVALLFQAYLRPIALAILAIGMASVLYRWFSAHERGALRLFSRTLPGLVGVALAMAVAVEGTIAWQEHSAVAALPATPPGAPNVVVIVIDALRADHLSAYGYERQTTPFIDGLAREGTLFETARSAAPYTLPSHASLLSGLFPYEHGVMWLDFKEFGKRDYPSIAESMRALGYRTGAFSANPFWFTREQGFGRGFIRFEDFYQTPLDMGFRTVFGKTCERVGELWIGLDDVPSRKHATLSTDRVLRWVRADGEHRFFAFINYFDAHDPYRPPEPWRSRFAPEGVTPGGALDWRRGSVLSKLTPAERESEMEAYDGGIAYADHEIGRLVEGIRRLRPDEDLLVVVTSDHGEGFAEHGLYLHGETLYGEEIAVPLIFWWPGTVPAGARIARPVSNASLPATLLELLAGPEAATYGSPSLVPLWSDGTAAATWPYPLSELGRRPWVDSVLPSRYGYLRSLTSPEWEYIQYETLPEELFGHEDIRQQTNRATDADLRDVLEGFRADLAARPRPSSP